jgi:hypothetical protein
MSIQEPITSTPNNADRFSGESPSQATSRREASWLTRRRDHRKDAYLTRPSIKPLLLCLAVAVVLRAWLTIHTQGFIDGDEALVGIQAQNILQGQFPVYFYHQPYMGSLEAYIMALIFAIAGSSTWTLRAEPTLLTLAVVWLTWRLAGELADSAKLPLRAKQWFMNIAALMAAIPPLYDTVMEMRMLGGYIESFILMLLLLLATLKLTKRRGAGASRWELALRWAGIGFLVGLGFWVNPLTSYAALAVALWLLWDAIKVLRQARQANERKLQRLARQVIVPALAWIPACAAGMAPAIAWGAANQWQNFTYLFQLNAALRPEITTQYPTRLSISLGLAKLLTTCAGPRVVGGSLPGTSALYRLLYLPTLALGICCIITITALVALSFARPSAIQGSTLARYRPLLLRARQLAGLPLVFALAVTVIFCGTSTAAIGLWNCQYDLAGRYATPLMLVLPFFYAAFFTMIILLEGAGQKGTNQEQQVDRSHLDHEDVRHDQGDPRGRPGLVQQIHPALLGLLASFLLLSVLFQVGLYGATDPGGTFQSPYCTFAPVNNDAIIEYMQQEHIRYAWANNWLAFPIDFKTHGSIIVSDPMAIIRNNPTLNRIPAYTNAVLAAERPSFIVLVKHDDPYPLLLQMLDVQFVKYRAARFPAQQGRDVLVVTPLNKTVDPTITAYANTYFNIFICSLDS